MAHETYQKVLTVFSPERNANSHFFSRRAVIKMIHCNKAWPRRGETGSLPRCWRRGGAKWCSCFEKLSGGSSKSYNKTQKSLFWYMPRRNENICPRKLVNE